MQTEPKPSAGAVRVRARCCKGGCKSHFSSFVAGVSVREVEVRKLKSQIQLFGPGFCGRAGTGAPPGGVRYVGRTARYIVRHSQVPWGWLGTGRLDLAG